jgi:ATP-binding cassette subfamily B protein
VFKSYVQSLFADPDGLPALVRRLMVEQASRQWKRYLRALGLMALAAASTALGAYLVGDVINQAYVHKNFTGILVVGLITAFIFMVKASATYLQAVKLSQIGNAIIADNQRRMFDTLIHQNLEFFANRHSTDLLARLTTGAVAASTTINLIVGAIGRDLLVLVGLLIVMFVQDPVMSFFSFIVVPPALFFMRKMIRRISHIAKRQFTGGARILETMQETLQGIRIVKAYTLEDTMRARLSVDIADLEQESNRWARTAHRAGPLMEAMGGFAIAFAMIYGGFRVLETGATPGEFFSFLAAFMLAYEPAKRLARLNIDLNTALVGVRILYDILDRPPGAAGDGEHDQGGEGNIERGLAGGALVSVTQCGNVSSIEAGRRSAHAGRTNSRMVRWGRGGCQKRRCERTPGRFACGLLTIGVVFVNNAQRRYTVT